MKQTRDNLTIALKCSLSAQQKITLRCEVHKALARHLPYLKDDTSSQSFASRNII